MSDILIDLRQSWRLFRRSPGLALTAVVALAMGIGFTTAMFGIVHGGTRAMPVASPEELVAVVRNTPETGASDAGVRAFEFRAWQASLQSIEQLGAFRQTWFNLSGPGQAPERVQATQVTPDTFATLGVVPLVGRGLQAADAAPGAAPVVVLSHAVWQTRFGADPGIVDRQLRLDGEPATIVGVMPPGFGFPIRARLWVPLAIDPGAGPGDGASFQVFGRLREDVTPAAASEELALAMARLGADEPATFAGQTARAFPFIELETPPDLQRALQLLVVVVALVLLAACANVANLLLARAAAQSHDTAIRAALGASRWRLVRQHLSEAVLLAGISTIVGLGIAVVALRYFAIASAGIIEAFWVDFSLDPVVVAFASGLGLLAAATAGLAPALRASSSDSASLAGTAHARVAGPRIGRLGRGLVLAQVAMACGLLIVTATLVGAAGAMRLVANPFPDREILTAQISVLPQTLAAPDGRRTLLTRLREAAAGEPALGTTAFVSAFPGRGAGNWSMTLDVPPTTNAPAAQASATPVLAAMAMVTPEFFALADARAVRGRLFTWDDDGTAEPVALVNESFVRRHLPDGGNPVGRRLTIGGASPTEATHTTIIGMVPDLLMQDIEDRDGAGVYVPMLQHRPFALRVMTDAGANPLAAIPALHRAVSSVDPDLPVIETATLRDAIFDDKRILDALAAMFFSFGLGAIFLATIGLHAVLSFVLTQRTREFGVRVALGASAGDIVRLVLRRGASELAWGLGLGLLLAAGLARVLASALERVEPAGTGALGLIAVVVLSAALVAAYRPVRRAIRLDPIVALRD